VSDGALRKVFKANLERLMAATPSLDSGPKLEAKSGVGASSISRWLRDPPSSAPTLDSVQAIAEAFGVQPWELLVDDRTTDKDIVDRLFRRR
jgi:transcriptional regulator with XRE-family HTH domain